MPDLSKMLGDVYDAPESQEPAPASTKPVPEWSDDEHLDRAFAGWTPGPSADAPAAERNLFAGADEREPLADDLATALSEAVLAEPTAAVPAVGEEAETLPAMRATAFGTLTSEAPVARPVVEEPPDEANDEVEEPVEDEPAQTEPVVRAHTVESGWQRADDDILPTGGKGNGSFSFSLRRR